MTFNTAIRLITSVDTNTDGGMKYTYDFTHPNKYRLTMRSKSGQVRNIDFRLKKEVKKMVYVKFTCIDFRINFPLLKQVERFKFNIYNFAMMLEYGIKTDEHSQGSGSDLDVEF